MPTYEYHCRDCETTFQTVQSMADREKRKPRCPECESKDVEQILTPFFPRTSSKS